LACVALLTIIVCNIWGKGMIKIIPIILGIVVSYLVALAPGAVDFTAVLNETRTVALAPLVLAKFDLSAIITIMPIALATMMEHIGDISAISATTGKNFIASPGLHRTLLGDGLATSLAALVGGPANTTYGENTGVLALTKVYDPLVIRIAACVAILLSFFAEIRGAGQHDSGGHHRRHLADSLRHDFGHRRAQHRRESGGSHVSRNLIIAAVILVSALGFNSIGGVTIPVGSANITLSGLAIAAIAGIVLNAVLPGNDYEFGKTLDGDTSVNFEI
jgi:uracil permease